MHVAEGVVPLSVAAGSALAAAGGVAAGLRRLRDEEVPRVALVSAAVFAASVLVRLPLGPSSVHPVLNGLAGLLLGWGAVPAFLVCLFLQALLFQFGGLTTLGVNTVVMALPAVLVHALLGRSIRRAAAPRRAFAIGAAAAVLALGLSYVLWAAALVLSGRGFATLVKVALVPHAGLMAVEALFTGFVVSFLVRVYPDAFGRAGRDEGTGLTPRA